jgi:hypothetical protein
MWRLKEHANNATKEENAERLKEKLESLRYKILEIKAIEVGINVNPSEAAFDVVLYSEFENLETLKIYQNHPEHKKIVDFVTRIRTDRCLVDYEK